MTHGRCKRSASAREVRSLPGPPAEVALRVTRPEAPALLAQRQSDGLLTRV